MDQFGMRPIYELESGERLQPTLKPEAAQLIIAAALEVEVPEQVIADETSLEVLKTSEEIKQDLDEQLLAHYWFLQPEYTGRVPYEQWKIRVHGNTTNVYNYVPNFTLQESDVLRMAVTIARVEASFPVMTEPLSAITVTDQLPEYVYDETEPYRLHGEAQPAAHMMALTPHTFLSDAYRPDLPVPTLDAVVIHELAHIYLEHLYEHEWEDAGFSWRPLDMSSRGRTLYAANQPEACITDYANVGGRSEDIAESIVGYLLAHGRLDLTKRAIIETHDRTLKIPKFSIRKANTVKAPKLPRHINYYVDPDAVD